MSASTTYAGSGTRTTVQIATGVSLAAGATLSVRQAVGGSRRALVTVSSDQAHDLTIRMSGVDDDPNPPLAFRGLTPLTMTSLSPLPEAAPTCSTSTAPWARSGST